MLVSSANALLRQFVSRGQGYLTAHDAQQSEQMAIMSNFDEYDEEDWRLILFLILWALAVIATIVLAVIGPLRNTGIVIEILEVIFVAGVVGGLIAWVLGLMFTWLIHYFIILPVDIFWAVFHWPLRARTRKNALARSQEAASAADQWRSAYQKEHEARVQQIERERDVALAAADAQHQQRLAEIAAEHARAMAEIAQRYPQG